MSLVVSIAKAGELVTLALKAGLTPMLHGSPALGKSAIVHSIAKNFQLKLIDIRLSQREPTDILGFPKIINGRSGYAPMESFPLEGDPLPEGYKGWLIFLDEITSATQPMQAAAYGLILDRMVGQYRLHPNVALVAAGNLETDNAIVEPMSTALKSRMVHLNVEHNVKEWLSWAYEAGFDHRITSFIEFRQDSLYTFNPNHTDKTYASPRTWEFTNKLLSVTDINRETLPLFGGTIGEGVAREFYAFCQLQNQLPKIPAILENPHGIDVPCEPSIQFALVGAIAANATEANVGKFLQYVKRIPAEFQVICLRSMVRRKKSLISQPAVAEWLTLSSAEIF